MHFPCFLSPKNHWGAHLAPNLALVTQSRLCKTHMLPRTVCVLNLQTHWRVFHLPAEAWPLLPQVLVPVNLPILRHSSEQFMNSRICAWVLFTHLYNRILKRLGDMKEMPTRIYRLPGSPQTAHFSSSELSNVRYRAYARTKALVAGHSQHLIIGPLLCYWNKDIYHFHVLNHFQVMIYIMPYPWWLVRCAAMLRSRVDSSPTEHETEYPNSFHCLRGLREARHLFLELICCHVAWHFQYFISSAPCSLRSSFQCQHL